MTARRLVTAAVAAASLCGTAALGQAPQAAAPASAASAPAPAPAPARPAPARAAGTQWQAYGESESGTFYFDPASIQARGERKRVWRLFELKDKRADGVQSGKALVEFDCKESTYRYLRTLYYGGPQGTGKFLGGAQAQGVEHVAPGSMIGMLAQKVCGA